VDLGLLFKMCLMELSVFVYFFACFSIWGSWSSAWRKKSPKKCTRDTGGAPLRPASLPPPPGPRPISGPPQVARPACR
jgi:hypothetical protein